MAGTKLTSCAMWSLGLLLVFQVSCGAKRIRCISGQYFDNITGQCARCSSCPMNQIIRQPCTADRDTLCGPFYEFQNFNQGSGGLLANHKLTLSMPSTDDQEVGDDTPEKNKDTQQDTLQTDDSQAYNADTTGPTVQRNDQHWKVLCFGLTGALAIITLLAILYIVVTQLQVRKARKNNSIYYADTEHAVYYKNEPSATDALAPYHQHHHHVSSEPERQQLYQQDYRDQRGPVPLRIIPNQLDPELVEGYIIVPGVHHSSVDSGLCSSTQNVAHV